LYNYIFDDNGVYIKNLSNTAEQYGIGQYRFPHSYELAGADFIIESRGTEHRLNFTRKDFMELDGKEFPYEALKITPDVYFARIGFYSAVVDTEQNLITLITGPSYFFGKIKGTDGAASHEDAPDDLTGTEVSWVLGCDRFVSHEFTEAGKVRVRWSPITEAYNDNPCRITKIKDALYIADITGKTQYHVHAPVYTGRFIAIQDYERMMTVGYVTGGGMEPVMFSGYGKFPEDPNETKVPGIASMGE